jgi:hypothetical protein
LVVPATRTQADDPAPSDPAAARAVSGSRSRSAPKRARPAAPPISPEASITYTPSSPEASVTYTPALPRLPIRDMSTEEVIITGVTSAAVLGAALAPWPDAQTGWRGGILFDDAARGAMMLHDPAARQTASVVSDGLVLGLTALPVLP